MSLSKKPSSAWDAAVLLVELYDCGGIKADQALERLPDSFQGQRRSSCQSLFFGALRHGHRTEYACRTLFKKDPKPLLRAILLVAGFEFLTEPEDKHPKIVHHAVERSKGLIRRHEQSFLNAILRKLPQVLASIEEETDLAGYYSHPAWLVDHWIRQFGSGDTRRLLQWNQRIPEHNIRIYSHPETLPASLEPTDWAGFFKISKNANWKEDIEPLLNRGDAYIKDPSTRIAPALLAPEPGDAVLDLCAAPGGKSFDLAHAIHFRGQLVAVDLPGPRIERLRQNLNALVGDKFETSLVATDLLNLSADHFLARKLPTQYDAVMLDAPCSNTGVIQRRTDVKWRLQPKDLQQCTTLQASLLRKAASLVRPGGRIVYSTCSIEAEENRVIVETFLATEDGSRFALDEKAISLPWQSGHDGASAFRLLRLH